MFFTMGRGIMLIASAVVLLGTDPILAPAAEGEDKECIVVRVPVVKTIDLEYDGTKSITVKVTGEVPTTGYTNVALIRRVYVKPPADGIWEYDMIACKPTGIVAQVLTPVQAEDEWESPPRGLKGIRVYGEGNGVKEVPVKYPKEKE